MTKLSADDPYEQPAGRARSAARAAPARTAGATASKAGSAASAGSAAKARPASKPAHAAEVAPPPPFERGARVRVTRGPFAGKNGVVQELVGRKSARVMLGLLPVQIDLDDLAPSAGGRGRPRLTSSHRKPVPARS